METAGVVNLDRTDLAMAFVAVKYYMRGHTLERRTPDLAAYRLAHHLEQMLSVDGHDSAGVQDNWLTVKQTAQRTGRSERHTRRLAQRIGRKVGRQWLIPADALPGKEPHECQTTTPKP